MADETTWTKVPCDSGACYEYMTMNDAVIMRSSAEPEYCMVASVEETRVFRDAVKAGFLDDI